MNEIVSRNIQSENIYVTYNGEKIGLQITKVRLWTGYNSDECDRFNVQLKINNQDARDKISDSVLDGGTWTVIAHSDHNPDGGHNIRSKLDNKQLHIDIHPENEGYTKVYDKICGGNPPKSNNKAINIASNYMKSNAYSILDTYINNIK